MSWDPATLDRVMCDQSSEMLLVVDPKSLQIIAANRQAEVTLGYEATPLVGRAITEVESSLADIFYWEDVRVGGGSDIDNAESMYICGDGVALPVIKSIRRLRGDVEDVLVLRVRDGASLKRGEAQLAALSGQLQATLESIWEGVLVLDSAGHIVNMNRRFSAMWEIPEAVLLQDSEAIIAFLMEQLSTPWQLQDDFTAFSQQVGLDSQAGCEITKLKNGRLFERRVRPQMDRGEVIGLVYSFHDISDFVHARQEAEEASRSKSRFLANMSHEIRTPMNAILGLLKLLQRTELSTRQRDYASKTEGAARSLLGLLNDILDFSKVEAGKLTLDPQPHALTQIFRDLSVILAANVGAKPVDLLFDLDPQLPPLLHVDGLRLLQVLINLAGNALKFTSSGEVVVGVQLMQRLEDAVRLEFTVTDTGIGIAPEHHAKIFSGFSQAEASTTRKFGGTGLGLAISLRLLELMGGQITLESALGQGSRFSFQLDLPVVQGEADGAQAPAAASQGLVLLIDDNARARELLSRMLMAEGWQVVATASVAEAQAWMAAAPDGLALNLVLADAQLPGEDVWACLAQLRARPGWAELPLVMSGTPLQLEALTPAEQALLKAFLVKPLMAVALRESLCPATAPPSDGQHDGEGAAANAGAAPLAGIRLLVVEDNLNNQQVARELLEDAGASVRLASNGQEAVDIMRADAGAVDLLLMDVQMPVMDGYTATRILREELGLRLPIVAMTANAMASDREECLAAGMDEHVGKPFDLDRLVRLIQKLGRPTGRSSDGSIESATEGVAETAKFAFPTLLVPGPLLEQALADGIEIQLAMDRFMGKLPRYQKSVASFSRSAAELPAQIEAALQARDWPAAQLQVHASKGMAAILGAERLAQMLAEGEARLEQGEAPDATWLAALPAQLQGTVAALTALADALKAVASGGEK
ncbi:hypothetical protein C1O66_17250 [Paucibacter aquatile]|uniref:Sensory/regulatory protein RpfC n=1 Tax=Kinneretia aquatilis TaxID=2070761 RepID=A0A2N8L055_9BURK|nr:response regulator [Paucibacter aquatile]PND39099.1 hypothetical protein C1O66_17250 [Paucibacter aquatile]